MEDLINNISKSEIYSYSKSPLSNLHTCCNAWSIVNDAGYNKEKFKIKTIKVKELRVEVLYGGLDECIWSSLPLEEHEIVRIPSDKISAIQESLNYLCNHHPKLIENYGSFLLAICFLQLKSSHIKDHICITSVSIPNFPFISFFSEKAWHHIPPSFVDTAHQRYLAENLLHEMIHNFVNINLLEKNILNKDYDCRKSIKIDIPWRAQASTRNQAWEIDRVFHALCVYQGILLYRIEELRYLKNIERTSYQTAIKQGLDCSLYLINSLLYHTDSFTQLGNLCLQEINKNIKIISSKIM